MTNLRDEFLVVVLISLLAKAGSAQPIWEVQNSNVTTNLYAISFCNALVGTVVGDNGTVLHTTNSGNLWKLQHSGVTGSLTNIIQLDTLNAIAAGYGGIIIRTSDGGNSWQQVASGITTNINALAFRNSRQGIAMGDDSIYNRTEDGGVSWQQYKQNIIFPVNYLSYTNDNEIFAGNNLDINDYTMIQSTDSGKTWKDFKMYYTGEPPYPNIESIWSANSQNLYICGGTLWYMTTFYDYTTNIYQSTDWGGIWNSFYVGSAHQVTLDHNQVYGAFQITHLIFLHDTICIAIDNATHLYSNIPTWNMAENPTSNNLNNLCISSDSVLYAVGDNGTILHLTGFQPTGIHERVNFSGTPSLSEIYPNPFSSSTNFVFTEGQEFQEARVVDMLGRQVAYFGKDQMNTRGIEWKPEANTPAGTYFLIIKSFAGLQTHPVVFMR